MRFVRRCYASGVVLDDDAVAVYGRVLIAIARADGEIGHEEATALERVLARRANTPLPLGELLFERPLRPEELARAVASSEVGAGPFRAAPIDLAEIARTLIDDALAIVLTKGSMTSGEQASVVRFATALGLDTAEVRARIAAATKL